MHLPNYKRSMRLGLARGGSIYGMITVRTKAALARLTQASGSLKRTMHSLQRFFRPSGEYLSVTNSEVPFSARQRSHCLLLTVGTRTCSAQGTPLAQRGQMERKDHC